MREENMITEDLGRIQYLAGVIKEEADYIPKAILTEEQELIFESFWNNYLVEGELGGAKREVEKILKKKYNTAGSDSAVEKLSDSFFDSVKQVVRNIWAGIKGAPQFVFLNINKLVWFIISTILFRPMQALMMGIGAAAVTLYNVLIDSLNIKTDPTTFLGMEIPGLDYAAGDKVNAAFMDKLEQGWDGFIAFVKSYEPDGLADAPIEIVTETIAKGLEAIGLVLPEVISATKMVGSWLLSLGLGNVATIIAWLYLIGGTVWLFKKAKPYIIDPITNFVKRQLPVFKDKMEEPAKEVAAET